jgi:hypothetical protein
MAELAPYMLERCPRPPAADQLKDLSSLINSSAHSALVASLDA